jgi:translocation and assembly module TamA
MRRFLLLFLPVLFFPAHADFKLCDTVRVLDGRLRLNANEKVLVCGSPKAGPGWREVPLSQAEYQLKVFLQREGYFTPSFQRRDGVLRVVKGSRTVVSTLEVSQGKADALDPDSLRKVEGYPLTSGMMDDVSQWANLQLKSHGYACAAIDVKAHAWDRKVLISASPGRLGTIRRVEWEGNDKLDRSVLDRYAAFESGETYDIRKTQITTNRLFADGLFEMALTQTSCEGDNVDLKVRTSVGKPRLLQFGFGASTEELPFMDLSFRNSRLDRFASSFYTILHASPKLQSLTAGSELYVFRRMPRVYWGPRLKLARRSENAFEEQSARAGADIGRYWDQLGAHWGLRGGPTLNYLKTISGIGPAETQFLNWEGSLAGASHGYELNLREQYEGWTGKFEYHGQREEIGSNINVDRYDGNLKLLWNIGGYSPPLFVLATRVSATAVDAEPIDLNSKRDRLPLDYRIFWGGDQNLRGFSRQSLNNGGLGYLTGVYGGFELRLIEELPWRLQPFVLYDLGRLGVRRWTADQPVFISKGFGLRWASPIGTLRGSAARGEIQNGNASTRAYPEEWVYFFSFGQEF